MPGVWSGLKCNCRLASAWSCRRGVIFITDLIGCEVRERETGNRLGVVRDVQPTGEVTAGTPLLVVNSPRGELLIPLALEICAKIDLVSRSIEILPPEGLLDLNLDS